MIRRLILATILALPAPTPLAARDQHGTIPRRVLWAWERREDLRFLHGAETGVAFLAVTLRLEGDGVIVVPRLQPLLTNPETPLIAVARIETPRGSAASLSTRQRERVVSEVLRVSRASRAIAVQIDSDATVSERPFYRGLLSDLRVRLPRQTVLSFTALASWCLGDNWLSGLAADEIVPMLFEMGPDGPMIRRRLASGQDFSSPECQTSLGFSTQEPLANPWPNRRVYYFSPVPWTVDAYSHAISAPR